MPHCRVCLSLLCAAARRHSAVQPGAQQEQQLLEARLEAGRALVAAGRLLCTLPIKLACNNPACAAVSKCCEVDLVNGKGCLCARCQRARYCCRECQATSLCVRRWLQLLRRRQQHLAAADLRVVAADAVAFATTAIVFSSLACGAACLQQGPSALGCPTATAARLTAKTFHLSQPMAWPGSALSHW